LTGEKPVIGVTKPSQGDNGAYALVALGVSLVGGRPVAITTESTEPDVAIDGIILGGGQDVFPMLFDDTPKQGYVYDRGRDDMEIMLAKTALKQDLPILAICRGAQLLNVAYGGSLHLDMTKAYEDAQYPDSFLAKAFYRKTITTSAGSLIQKALGAPTSLVNSLHKQAVKELGQGLKDTAREKNGIVQAIEDPEKRFVLGVQFHPEFMLHRRKFRRIFEMLIEAAKTSKALTPLQIKAMSEEATAGKDVEEGARRKAG